MEDGSSVNLTPEHNTQRLQELDADEAKIRERLSKANAKLGSMSILGAHRDRALYQVSELLSERHTTDPFTPHAPSRSRETVYDRATLGALVGRMALKHSLNGPNGEEIRSAKERAQVVFQNGTPQSQSRRARNYQLKTERRLRKQEELQNKAKRAEAIMGVNFGNGFRAKTSDYLRQRDHRKESEWEFREGAISASEHLDALESIKRDQRTVIPRAVRKRIRRERFGALRTQLAVGQPVRSALRRGRQNRVSARVTKYNEDLGNIQAERERLSRQ